MVDGALEGVRRRQAAQDQSPPSTGSCLPRHLGGEGIPVVRPPLSFHEPDIFAAIWAVPFLTETIHQIGARAERRVDRELLDDLKRVSGKQNLLFDLVGAALDHPDGIVREVVFPVVGEQTLRDLVQEAKATGPIYRRDPQLLQGPLSADGAA